MPLSVQAGSRLAPCQPSPNCVSSLAEPGRQAIEPFPMLKGTGEKSLQCLKGVVKGMRGARIAREEKGYFRAEFKTLLGFVDDVEFEVDASQEVIHVRSASRVGTWDLGVNRRRVERIRGAFKATCQ